MANKKNNKPENYLAFDSDFLRALVRTDELLKSNKDLDFRFIQEFPFSKYGNLLKKIMLQIIHNELKPVILEGVYNECKHIKPLHSFIQQYCYVDTRTNTLNCKDEADAVYKLATAYCTTYEVNGKDVFAPMHMTYNALTGQYQPSNDAVIMAQATRAGVCLATLNKKDYIVARKSEDIIEKQNDSIVSKIIEINKQNPSLSLYEENSSFTIRPYSIARLFKILSNRDNELFSKENMKVTKASELIK